MLAALIVAIIFVGPGLWMLIRVHQGLPAFGRTEGRIVAEHIETGSQVPLSRRPVPHGSTAVPRPRTDEPDTVGVSNTSPTP